MGKKLLALAAALAICVGIPFVLSKSVAQICFIIGREGSSERVMLLMLLLLFGFGALISFLGFRLCVIGLKAQVTLSKVIVLGLFSLICSIGSVFVGPAPYKSFLEGFSAPASLLINPLVVLEWANRIFAKSSRPNDGSSVLRLPPSEVLAIFSPVFAGKQPAGVVSFSDQNEAICVYIFLGGGLGKWGIAVFDDSLVKPTNSNFEYREVSNRIYTFHSSK